MKVYMMNSFVKCLYIEDDDVVYARYYLIEDFWFAHHETPIFKDDI